MTEIIFPVYNEEQILLERESYFNDLKRHAKVIFVDGGSSDRTIEIAKEYGEVVVSRRGRSLQMNMGAEVSQADSFLFLHVDTLVDREAIASLNNALSNGVCGGCFTMQIEERGAIFRVFEKIVNFRARKFGVIDGDLGLFVKKDIFNRIGRFDRLPIMEDILFSKKMRRAGQVVALPNPIRVSARKWHKEGFGKTFAKYTLAYIQLWTKIPFFKFK